MTAPNIPSTIRKAALLVVGLERATADALLAQMPRDQAERIRGAVAELGQVDPREQEAVVEEFFRMGPFKTKPLKTSHVERGVETDETDGRPHGRLSSPAEPPSGPAPEASLTRASSHRNDPPFAFLQHYDAAEIAAVLTSEHSQITAVVVSHLSARQAADVLARLSPELRGEVVDRMIGSNRADEEVLCELASGLRTSLLGKSRPDRPTSTGVAVVRSILEAAERPLVDGIIAGIARRDHLLAGRLRTDETNRDAPDDTPRRPVSFDDLVELDDADLDTLLHALDADVLTLALTGCPPRLLERILERLPPPDRSSFARALDHLGPTRLSDVEAARRSVGMLAQSMADEDRITLPGPQRLSVAA